MENHEYDDDETFMTGAIGWVCVNWAYLEYLIAIATWGALGLSQEYGKRLTDTLDIEYRSQILIKFADRRFNAEDVALIRSVAGRIQEIAPDRHLAVHGLWHSEGGKTW